MDWVEGWSPLINPAGPDCGLRIRAVMMVAATPPMIIATICWSLKGFFIARLPLTRAHGTPHHGDALGAGKLHESLCRRTPEHCAVGGALDDKGAGAGAVRRRVGYCDPLHGLGDREVGRDVAARPDSNRASDR